MLQQLLLQMKKLKYVLSALSLCMSLSAAAQSEIPESPQWDIYPDTWVATDGAGRVMPDNSDVGDYKMGKQHTVGIFYVTWHTAGLFNMKSPYNADVSRVLEKDPTARMDKDNAAWEPQYYNSYHWGEPEMGYFLSADPFVIRRDVSMLADAGVDVLILDVTNAVRYWDEWNALFKVLEDMKSEGNKVPQICFWSYNGDAIYVVQEIYDLFYAKQKYKDLWFYWYGKPLLLYNAEPSYDANGTGHQLLNYLYSEDAVNNPQNPHYGDPLYTSRYLTDYPDYIKEFFTLRNMWWGYKNWYGHPVGEEDRWSFGYDLGDLDGYSAEQLVTKHEGKYEEYAVTPAQHSSTLIGKSWTRAQGEPQLDEYDLPVAQYIKSLDKTVDDPESYGIYFQERWDEALSINPEFIYLNDWNEYSAGKYTGNNITFMRRQNNGFHFIDQYNAEFNRTIGPVKGKYTDNYYMQMATNIRKYKGARAIPQNYGLATDKIATNDTTEWNKIKTEYRDTKGDITHRSFNGYGGLKYTDNLGRNDIVRTKVAVTSDSIYFRVETAEKLSPCTDAKWMLLFIDADNNHSTGWNGYDYVVNKTVENATTSTVMQCNGDSSQWTKISNAHIVIDGNVLIVAVSRKNLKLTGNDLTFDFKWVDNARDFETPIGLATAGDAAPNRRFNYRFIWHKDGSETITSKKKLTELVEKCNAGKFSEYYAYGDNPGMVADSNVVARYAKAFNDAYYQASDNLTDEQYDALHDELQNSLDALKNAATVPFADGYYYIVSANSAYFNATMAMDQASASSHMLHWQQLNEDKENFVWKLSAVEGGYTIQNRSSSQYINRSLIQTASATIRLTDTIGAKQTITPLNHAGQINIANDVFPDPYYQKGGDAGTNFLGSYITLGTGGANSCAAWKLVNADRYFLRNLKNPLDSVANLAKEKVNSATVIVNGAPDPLSPAFNEALKPYIASLSQLLERDTLLDMYSITRNDIDSLSKAYDALISVWPDSNELALVCKSAEDFLANNHAGNEVGEILPDAHQTLTEQYQATISRRPFYAVSRSELIEMATLLRNTLDVAEKSVTLPAEGAWYNIVNADTTIKTGDTPNGECLYAYSNSPTSVVYWGGTPQENNRKMRSAWRFVCISDSTYALQNVGSGWYLGVSAKEGDLIKMSETPVEYTIRSNGDKQWTLMNAERLLPLSALSKRRYVSLNGDSTGVATPTSWVIARVSSNISDSLNAVEGSFGVVTLPYAQKELPKTVNGEQIKFYVISGSQMNESGKTIAVDLTEYRETAVPAGYPLIYCAGTEYKINSMIPFIITPDIDSEISTESQNQNGLVGVAKSVILKNDTCGYLSMKSVVPVVSSYIVAAQSGYVNAKRIVNIPNAVVDATLTTTGNGLCNKIGRILRESNERVDVYSIDGILVRSAVEYSKALKGLEPGIYVVGKQKFEVK